MSADTEICPVCGLSVTLGKDEKCPKSLCALSYRIANLYRLDTPLGKGGFGLTYKAFDTRFNDSSTVVKEIETRKYQDQELKMLRSCSALTFIPKIYDFSDSGRSGYNYIIMERIFGKTLRELVGTGWPEEQVEAFLNIMLKNLDRLHNLQVNAEKKGIIHRDLKPANIMLRDGTNDEFVLLDLGISKRVGEDTGASFKVVGTPLYAPVEQKAGLGASEGTDLFSLGMICCYLVVGEATIQSYQERAYKSWRQGSETYEQLMQEAVPVILNLVQARAPRLAEKIRALLELDWQKRPSSARQAMEQLKPGLGLNIFGKTPAEVIMEQLKHSSHFDISGQNPPQVEDGENIRLPSTIPVNNDDTIPNLVPIMRVGYGRAVDLAWSEEGQRLVVGSTKGIFIYKISAHATSLQERYDTPETVKSLALLPGNAGIATLLSQTFEGGQIWQWTSKNQRLELIPESASYSATALAFHPDGQTFAIISNKKVKLWRVGENQPRDLATPNGEPEQVLGFTSQKGWLATGLERGRVQFWDKDGNPFRELNSRVTERVTRLAFTADSPDGELMAIITDHTVSIWSLTQDRQTWRTITEPDANITSVAFSADGNIVAVANSDGSVKLWRKQGGNTLPIQEFKYSHSVDKMAFTPNRAATSEMQLALLINGQVFIRSFKGQPELRVGQHFPPITALTFAPDSSLLATQDEVVRVWDCSTRAASIPLYEFPNEANEATGLVFTRDTESGLNLAVISENTTRFWKLENGSSIRVINSGSSWPEGALLYRPRQDKYFITVTDTIKFWRSDDGKLMREEKEANPALEKAQSVILGLKGDRPILGVLTIDNQVYLWQLSIRNGIELLNEFEVDSGSLNLTLAPNARCLAVVWEEKCQVWDITRKKASVLKTLTSGGWQAVFSPDSEAQWLALSKNNTIEVWRWQETDPRAFYQLTEHNEPLARLTFARQDTSEKMWLASASLDGTALLWELISSK